MRRELKILEEERLTRLVAEERRGKRSFYSLDREAVRRLLGETAEHLGVISWARDVVTVTQGD